MPFLLRRTAGFLLTLLAVSLVVFLVMNVLPGDPTLTILGIDSTPDARAALRAQLGLDAPLWHRYLSWLFGILHGDFGTSYAFGEPVAGLIVERLPVTIPLALGATCLTIVTALGLGVFSASRFRKAGDWAVLMISQIGIALPVFWLALLLVLVFAVKLHWLPPAGFPGWASPLEALRSLILPTVSLALVQSAVLTRVARASILEVMRLDFARTARAMGYSHRRVMWRHILPNALVPIITVSGMQFAGVVTGTIVIENVFALPGLGKLIYQAISNRDLITVQTLVLLFAAIVVSTNFAVDLLYTLIDPRLKSARS